MLDNLDARPSVAIKPALSWPQIWLAAVARPTTAAYQELVNGGTIRLTVAFLWILGSGLISGLILSAGALFRESETAFGADLALAIPIFAFLHTLACVVFAGCVHGVARLLRGRGGYQKLVNVCAAFNAPLALLAGLFALVPRNLFLMLGVYLYWLLLYSLATQVVYGLSWRKAAATVLVALLVLGGAVFGAALLILI
jgi:hypothetical protein